MIRALLFLAILLAGCADQLHAGTLDVGPGKHYATPSKAIAAASSGDTIRIFPGQYYDCAIVRRNNITIEGVGPGVVMTDTTCAKKAILVIDGNNITIRNLTLQRARVPDQNGAGIRAEGGNLTVIDTKFLDNEDGILSAANANALIRIIGSTFEGNGKCNPSCAHGIYIGRVGMLDVENSRFFNTHEGHHIKSRALRTRIVNCDIEDGPKGNSSYLIDVSNGGDTVIEHNILEKGPNSVNWSMAIPIGEEGVRQPTTQIIVRDNVFTNDTGHPTVFVHNFTATPAQLSGNVFKGGEVRPLQGDGSSG